jgi:2-iminoacetate synthase
LRPAEGTVPNFIMDDRDLTQLICAYRLWKDLEISISTRENENFRNNIIPIGTTSMSAGSKRILEVMSWIRNPLQFEISDERSAQEIATLISNSGYEPVWKD